MILVTIFLFCLRTGEQNFEICRKEVPNYLTTICYIFSPFLYSATYVFVLLFIKK
jgi:hypothetical protein